MSEPVEKTLNPSQRELRYVESYTKKMRKKYRLREPFSRKISRAFEALNRKVAYQLLQMIFMNEPLEHRLHESTVNSVFVIPFGGAVGDMIVALPVIHAIRRRLPNCKIGTFVSERNQTLLESDPAVSEVFQFRDGRAFRNIREILRARRSRYDVVVNMHIHRMTEYGLVANVIAPHGKKVSWTHSARKQLYQTLFNVLIPFDRDSMQESQVGLVMAEALIEFESPLLQWESRPTIAIAEATREKTGARISETLDRLGARSYVHVNLQARHPFREWGLDNSIAFARWFVDRYPDAAVLFSSSPVLRNQIEESISKLCLPRVALFPTSFDLKEVALLAEGASLVVTPDTAITHLAAAGDRPTIILYPGLRHLPLEWISLQVPSFNLAPEHADEPASAIAVADVCDAACRLLEGQWTKTATSLTLQPHADAMFQAEHGQVPLQELMRRSKVVRVFANGSKVSVPISDLVAA